MDNASKIRERLDKYLLYKGISRRQFQVSIEVSNAYFCNMVKAPGNKTLKKIRENYPDLNIDWLITGDGKMIDFTHQELNNVNSQSVSGRSVSVGSGNSVGGNFEVGNGTSEIDIIKKQSEQIDALIQQNKEKDQQIQELIKKILEK